MALSEKKGAEIDVRGIVQGVGFRPFIYTLAKRYSIAGTVANTQNGVVIKAWAAAEDLEKFTAAISDNPPPLARIHSVKTRSYTPHPPEPDSFTILPSRRTSSANTAIPADIALCDDCLEEMFTAEDRRYLYPFTNCTNCGPRFTIVEDIPYDRAKTSMKHFIMCKDCMEEYSDPSNRRFHAQPNACAACGPHLSLHDAGGETLNSDTILKDVIQAIQEGKVIAIRGLGGFHLCVDATNPEAVALLRRRKQRPDKPLAVMVETPAVARKYCNLSEHDEEILLSPAHPIVLVKRGDTSALAENLNPGIAEIGIMLPYTPLHHLLFKTAGCPAALVMTSGNTRGVPICISNEDGLAKLSTIADLFLLHNREILTRIDDSVVKTMAGTTHVLRRARGYCPAPIELPVSLPHALACGGGFKSTFALSRDKLAFVSQHIGDLFSVENYQFYLESIAHHNTVFQIHPEIVIRDLHPDFLSSRYAETLNLPVYTVQHHHAHAVSAMAEHGINEDVLAVVFDGTGLGDDNTIWGGEIFRCNLTTYERLGHLEQIPLPGGDKAAEQPWRMALSFLIHLYGNTFPDRYLPESIQAIESAKRNTIVPMIEQGLNSPLTSSCGRLFDSVAALLDLRQYCSFEGQAAMELETLAKKGVQSDFFSLLERSLDQDTTHFLHEEKDRYQIISSSYIQRLLVLQKDGIAAPEIALDFHVILITVVTKLLVTLSKKHSIDTVILSGGSMQNQLLLEGLLYTLGKAGLHTCSGNTIPVNDGGLSLGQLVAGGLQHVSCHSDAGH